jgi:hypothetical protein
VEQRSARALSTSKGGNIVGNVIFVLAVIAFWAFVFVLVMFLIRMSTGSRDNEQAVSDLPEDYYETTDNSAALT